MKNNLHSEISKILDRDGLRTWAIKHGKNPEVVDIGVDKIITQILALIKKHEREIIVIELEQVRLKAKISKVHSLPDFISYLDWKIKEAKLKKVEK